MRGIWSRGPQARSRRSLAFHGALMAALWSDLIDPDIYEWLVEPWMAGMAAVNDGAST
jgi:hypothetical protein